MTKQCEICGSEKDIRKIDIYFDKKTNNNVYVSAECLICEDCLNECRICSTCGKKIKTEKIKNILRYYNSLIFCNCEKN